SRVIISSRGIGEESEAESTPSSEAIQRICSAAKSGRTSGAIEPSAGHIPAGLLRQGAPRGETGARGGPRGPRRGGESGGVAGGGAAAEVAGADQRQDGVGVGRRGDLRLATPGEIAVGGGDPPHDLVANR